MADLMVACLVMPLGAVYVVTYFLTKIKTKSDVKRCERNRVEDVRLSLSLTPAINLGLNRTSLEHSLYLIKHYNFNN